MGLIERILEKVISDHAGEFLKVNREQLAASLMRGEVTLTGVELRVEAFKEMMKMLPFCIKSCKVKTLRAKVPWNELSSKSVRVHVSGVDIVLGPQSLDEPSAGDSWADVLKRQRLKAAEMLMDGMMEGEAEREVKRELETSSTNSPATDDRLDDDDLESEEGTASLSTSAATTPYKKKSRMTLLQRVVARIVDNLQITVEHLNLRYEDAAGFTLGVQIDEFNLFTVSADNANELAFVDRTVRPMPASLKRRVRIRGLSLFWQDSTHKKRKDLIKPLGVGVTLTQHLVANPPFKLSLDARIEGRIVLSIGPEEYADMTRLVERLTAHDEFVTRTAILKHRPLVSPKQDPIGWWRFAIRAVMTALRQDRRDETDADEEAERRKKDRSWSRVMRLIQQRWKYVLLYKRRLIQADSKYQARARKHSATKGISTPGLESSSTSATSQQSHEQILSRIGSMAVKGEMESEQEEEAASSILRELEIELPFQRIMLFRAFAEAEFREEKARLKKLHRSKKIPVRALNAMVQGATSGRRMVLRSLGLTKSTAASTATSSTMTTEESTTQQQQPAIVWTLDAKEKQELYESVAIDPATNWMIEKTSLGTTNTAIKRFGFDPSLELSLVIPILSLQLFSNATDPILELKLCEMKIKLENSGLVTLNSSSTNKRNVIIPLWNVDASLKSADLIDMRPEIANQTMKIDENVSPNQPPLDHRNIAGSLRTTSTSVTNSPNQNPLVQLSIANAYVGNRDRTRIKIVGEIRPTQLVVSVNLIEKLLMVVRERVLQGLDSVAPATLSRIRKLRALARNRVKTINQQKKPPMFDVRIDWDTPSICIPISFSEKDYSVRALEFDLGRFRVRTSTDESQLEIESHGVKSAVRKLQLGGENTPGRQMVGGGGDTQNRSWVLPVSGEDDEHLDYLLEKMNVEVKLNLDKMHLELESTPIVIRLDDRHVGTIGMIVQDGLALASTLKPAIEFSKAHQAKNDENENLSNKSKGAMSLKPLPVGLAVKVPKLDVHMAVPCRQIELRRKRPGWGDATKIEIDQDENGELLLPSVGWFKLRLTEMHLSGERNVSKLNVKLGTIHARDDLQRAGEYFRDLCRVDGPIHVEIDQQLTTELKIDMHIDGDVLVNWNPSSMDSLLFFLAHHLVLPISNSVKEQQQTGSKSKALSSKLIPDLNVSIPNTVRFMMNQETIGTRMGMMRIENIRLATSSSSKKTKSGEKKILAGIRNFSMYGLQWEPLTCVRGVQLFGSELKEELERKDDFITVQVDLDEKLVEFVIDRGRFLWAHTLTKQFADYFSDGIAQVVGRHFKSPSSSASPELDSTASPPPLQMLIKGVAKETSLVAPALRFGEQFKYNPQVTDEYYALIHEAFIDVSIFDAKAKRNCTKGMFRSQDAAGCGRDATKSLGANGAESDGLEQQDPVVEIRIECPNLELESVKRPAVGKEIRANLCRNIKGRLAWHIVDFTQEQLQARAKCQPLTARETARLRFDQQMMGESGIPYGEHPHGVSPQKFEMAVEIDMEHSHFEMSPTDIHLMFLVIIENILDHRRRIARAQPPRMPLFESDPFKDWGDDLVLGEDELVDGDFGEIAVKSSRFTLPPSKMTEQDLEHDYNNFTGGGPPPIVDLDLTLRIPQFKVVIVTPETRLPIAEFNCTNFEMALSEFYDRTQFIELSLDRLLVTSPSSPRISTGEGLPPFAGLMPSPGTVLLDVRPSSFLKNPAIVRVRNSDVQFGNLLTHWHYERVSKPVYIMITKFPQKDRRVEVGLERLEVNLDVPSIEYMKVAAMQEEMMISIQDAADRKRLKFPGYPGGPTRARRALVLEIIVNRYGFRLSASSLPPEEIVMKGSAHLVLATNRTSCTRVQLQTISGVALRALSDDELLIQADEEEDSSFLSSTSSQRRSPVSFEMNPNPADFDDVFRFWLEDVYTRRNPVKLGEVDSILRAFAGNESELIQSVCKKYQEEPFDLTKFRKLYLAKHASVASSPAPWSVPRRKPQAQNTGNSNKYQEVTIIEPFGIRLDVNADSTKVDLVAMTEPLQSKLTNGHLEACANVLRNYDVKRIAKISTPPSSASISAEVVDQPVGKPTPPKAITVTILMHGLEVNLVNDYGSSHTFPLLRASLSGLAVKFTKNTRDVKQMMLMLHVIAATRTTSPLEAGLAVARIDYFNPRLLAWEPLLEPWEFELQVQRWSRIEVKSRRPLNLNLTFSFVESFAYWLASRSARRRGRLLPGSSHSEYYIVNETGMGIVFHVPGEMVSKRLESGQRAPLRLGSKLQKKKSEVNAERGHSGGFYRDPRQGLRVGEDEAVNVTGPVSDFTYSTHTSSMSAIPSRHVGLGVQFMMPDSEAEFGRLGHIGIDSFGTFVYGLNRPSSKVTVHVSLEHGSKVVRLLSPVQFRNITDRPLTLLVSDMKENQHWALGPIPADKSTFPIPLDKLHCEFRIKPVTPVPSSRRVGYNKDDASTAPQNLSRAELEAESAGAISRTSDENGYGWSSPAVNLLQLHRLVDHPVALMCDRSRSFSRNEKKGTFYEQDSFRGGGAGYRFTTFLGVESFESSDDMGLRETYVVTISPIMRVENRLPCPLLVRSIKREIIVAAGDADLPVSGGRICVGEDSEIIHVAFGAERRRNSLGRLSEVPLASPAVSIISGRQQQQQQPEGSADQPSSSTNAAPAQHPNGEQQPLTTSYQILRDVWLNVTLPGFSWSVPFQPTSQAHKQSVVVSHSSRPDTYVRLMLDCDQLSTGMLRVAVFVESWFINDARRLVNLQYREGGVGGEQIIYEMGSKFKDRGGQAANLIYELGQNLKQKAMMRGSTLPSTPTKQQPDSPTVSQQMSSSRSGTPRATGRENSRESPRAVLDPSVSAAASNDTQFLGALSDDDEEDVEETDFGLFSEGRNVAVRFLMGANSHWSSSLSLDSVGAHSDVICGLDIEDHNRKRQVQGMLGMSVRVAPSIFRRSRIVTFCPRMVFINRIKSQGSSALTGSLNLGPSAPSGSYDISARTWQSAATPAPATFAPSLKTFRFEEETEDDTVICFSSSSTPSIADNVLTCWVESINAMVLFDPVSLQSNFSQASDFPGEGGEPQEQKSSTTGMDASSSSPEEARRIAPVLRLIMRKKNEWWGWSGPFSCSENGGEFALKLRNPRSGLVCVVRVKSEERDACTVVSVEEESQTFPLYCIVSQTDEPIHYFQPLSNGGRGVVERLIARGSSRVFGWDEPNAVNRVVRLGFRGDSLFHDVKIDELSMPTVIHLPSSRQKPGRSLWVSVRIRGITKTLLITDKPPPTHLREISPHLSASDRSSLALAVIDSAANATMQNNGGMDEGGFEHPMADDETALISFKLELAQIGLSLIDRAPQELLYVSLTDVLVDYAKTGVSQTPGAQASQRLAWAEDDDDEEYGETRDGDQDVDEDDENGREEQKVEMDASTKNLRSRHSGQRNRRGTRRASIGSKKSPNRESVDALDISIRRVQIDSQLSEAQFPVLLGPSKSWLLQDESVRPLMFRLSLVRRLPATEALHRFDYFEFASLQVYEIDLRVEDALLLLLGRMAWECAMSLRSEEELVSGRVDSEGEGAYARLKRWTAAVGGGSDADSPATPRPQRSSPQEAHQQRQRNPASSRFSILAWLAKRPTRSLKALARTIEDGNVYSSPEALERRKIYFGLLHIFPLNINLTFQFTAQDPRSLLSLSKFKTASALRGDQVGIGLLASFDADYVARSLPPALINVDNARIRLLPLFAPHILADKKTLAKTVARHYSRQAITQVYRILGSSDLMGNPLGVVSDIGIGLNDFVTQPILGLAKASPTEFVKGLGRGTFSLLRHVTLGTFDALSKVTGALGAGVALLSLDHRFVAERWNTLRFEQPRTAGSGLALGMRSLARSLYESAGGIVVRPLRSVAEEGSAQAFARELGLGLVGAVVKPVVGLLDLTSRASNGVVASVQRFDPEAQLGWQQKIQRVRLPRAFKGQERRLDPYLDEDALVSHMIKLLETSLTSSNSAAVTDHFDYQTHAPLDGTLFLVAAGQRLWCLNGGPVMRNPSGNTPPERLWDIPLAVVQNMTASKEPEFPAVRIWIDKPSAFHRMPKKKSSSSSSAQASTVAQRGGAADAELVVLGSEISGTTQARDALTSGGGSNAIIVFHVQSHLRARAIVRAMRIVLPTSAATPGNLSRQSSLGTISSPGGEAQSPRKLGLAIGPLPSQMKKLAGPAHVGGAGVVLRVVPDTAASRSGLQVGDIVLTCNGESMDRDNPLVTLKTYAMKVPPQEIVLTVRRAPSGRVLKCVLGVESKKS